MQNSESEFHPRVSLLLPCYNESEVIEETYRRVKKVCENLGTSYEIVLVNDGSQDDTWRKLNKLAESDEHVVAINLSRNHGHQLALSAGLSFVKGERILIMDADLQDPPELLPALLSKMDEGIDVVYAQRRSRPGDSILKRIFCALYYRLLLQVADSYIPLDTGDFRLITRRVCDLLVAMPERQRYIRGMVSWVGFRQEPLLYDRDARFAGETKYPLRKLIGLAIDGIISSTRKPLSFAAPLGFVAVGISAIFGFYAFLSWCFVGKTPQGWTSLLLAIVFMSGLQLVVLGILGEYLGRIHEQVRGRPLFLVESVVQNKKQLEKGPLV